MFKLNIKIKTKVLFVMVLSCLICLAIGWIGLNAAVKINNNLNEVYENSISTKYLGEVKANMQRYRVAIYNHIISTSKTDLDEFYNFAQEYKANVQKNLAYYKNTKLTEKEKGALSQIESTLKDYETITEKIFQISSQGTAEANAEAWNMAMTDARPVAAALDALMETLINIQNDLAKNHMQDAKEEYDFTRIGLILFIVIGAFLTFGLGIILSRSIAKPIGYTSSLAGVIAQGDFTNKIPDHYLNRKDEIGVLCAAFKNMQENLRNLAKDVMGSSESLAAATQQMSASTEQISTGAQEQASRIQEITASIEQVASAAKKVSEKAQKVWEVAHNSGETAKNGEGSLKNVKDGIDSIDEKMKKLDTNSAKIGEIVNVINEIAEQTNLLALNAAIEAARAGEYGRGFAVVAEEVRKLAERSGMATKEISQLVSTIQKDTGDVVEASKNGGILAINATKAFGEIQNLIETNNEMVNDIVEEIKYVGSAIDQVASASESISAITEESVAGVEEMSASAADMAGMAEKLQVLISHFKI